jgi:hypothetical protein
VTEAEWIDRFTMKLGSLCEQARPGSVQPEQLAEMARETYIGFGMLDPEQLAQSEFDERPPFG